MKGGDHRGLHHLRMAAGRVLQGDRADPFAAGLDEVFRPVDDRHVAVRIDRGNVAGLEPALRVERVARALEVSRGDPGRLGAEMADRHAVVRQGPLLVVDDAELRAEPDTTAGLHALLELLLRRQVEGARMQARAGQAERLGHTPELVHLDAPGRKGLQQTARRGRARGIDRAQMRQRPALARHPVGEHEPHGGHAARDGDPLALEQLVQHGRLVVPAGEHELGAGHGCGVGKVPAVGVEQGRERHQRLHRPVPAAAIDPLGEEHRHEHAGPMGVHDALRVAGGARGVADRRRVALVELRPPVVVGFSGEQLLVAEERLERRAARHGGALGHQDEPLHRLEPRRELLGEGQGRRVDEQPGILGVVDDVDDLVGEQPRIHRMQHGARAGHAVEQLEVAMGVPAERADPVTRPHPEPAERVRQALGSPVRLGIRVAVDGAVDVARDDLGPAMKLGGVLDGARDHQRHVHDQALQHALPSPGGRLVFCLSAGSYAREIDSPRRRRRRRAFLRVALSVDMPRTQPQTLDRSLSRFPRGDSSSTR